MIIITGGGSGIGRALAQELALRGENVLIVGRRQQALDETAQTSSLIQCCCADVSGVEGRQKIADALTNTAYIKALVHNAGVIEPIAPLAALDVVAFEQALATNLTAPLFLTQLLLSKLTQSRVLHIGTAAAYFPIHAWAAYCVSKAGLSMLTRCWQLENGVEPLSFASVMPGIIDTDMQAVIRHAQTMEPDKLTFFQQLYENHKLLSPATVAQFLSWLLLRVTPERYVAKEWDIYDQSHHPEWLVAPHQVPDWESV